MRKQQEETISCLEVLLDAFPSKHRNKSGIRHLRGDVVEAYVLSKYKPCDYKPGDKLELLSADKKPLEFVYTSKNDWLVINSLTGRLLKFKLGDVIEFLGLKRVGKGTYKGSGQTDGASGLEITLQKTVPLIYKYTVVKISETQDEGFGETEIAFDIDIKNEHKRKRRHNLSVSQLKAGTYRFKPSAKRILIHPGKSKKICLYTKAKPPNKPRQNLILYLNSTSLHIRTASQEKVNKIFRVEERAYREKFLKIRFTRGSSTTDLFIKPEVFKKIYEIKEVGYLCVIRQKEPT